MPFRLNLTEFALTEIIKSYSDILEETELAQAKLLLNNLLITKKSADYYKSKYDSIDQDHLTAS